MKLAKNRWMAIILGVSLFLGAFGIALAATVVFQVTRQVDSALSLSAALVLADENLGLYHDADATQPFTGEEKLEFLGFRLQPPLENRGKAHPEAPVYIKNESNIDLTLIAPCGEVLNLADGRRLGHLDGHIESAGGEEFLGYICEERVRLAPGQVVFVRLTLDLDRELPEGAYGFTTVFGAVGEGEEPQNFEIFVMDVADLDGEGNGEGNGDNLTSLTASPGWDGRHAWHPNGSQIAFCTEKVGFGDFEIFVVDAVDTDGDGNGDNPTQLTNAPGFSCNPDWLERIVFYSTRDGDREIYVMDPVDTDGDSNGDNLTRLTDNEIDDFFPDWSPTDGRIASVSTRDGNGDIYVMDSVDTDGDGNGDNLVRLTANEADDFCPAWSPDGGRIAFHSNRDGNFEIYVMDTADVDGDGNGDNLVRLTTIETNDAVPEWSPDGSSIAFRSNREYLTGTEPAAATVIPALPTWAEWHGQASPYLGRLPGFRALGCPEWVPGLGEKAAWAFSQAMGFHIARKGVKKTSAKS